MKNLFKPVLVLVVGVVVASFAGCKDYDNDIVQLNNKMTAIEQKISVLETLKSWTEGQVSTLGSKDADLQKQIDDLDAALNAANAAIDALGSSNNQEQLDALERRLNTLIAGSTLTIAQIESRLKALEDADYQSQIDALYVALEALDVGAMADLIDRLVGRVSDLEERLDALTASDLLTEEDLAAWFETNYGTDIDDLWDAIDSIEPADLTELEERLADLEEAIAGLWQGLIQSITYLPSAAEVTVDGIEDAALELIDLNPFTLEFLITPATGAALLDETMIEGIFNTYTRTLGATVPVTSVMGDGSTGVLTVTFDPDTQPLFDPAEIASQIALRVALESGENLTSGFVDLTLDLMPGSLSREITLGGQFYQGPIANDFPVTTYPTAAAANPNDFDIIPELIVPAATGEFALDLQAEGLSELRARTLTYAIATQYEYDGNYWQEVDPVSADVESNGLVKFAASSSSTYIVVKLTIASADLAANPFVTYVVLSNERM
jgi:hypothetical protein